MIILAIISLLNSDMKSDLTKPDPSFLAFQTKRHHYPHYARASECTVYDDRHHSSH